MRPDLSRVPQWSHGYISEVTENDLSTAFNSQSDNFLAFLNSIPVNKRNYKYGADKWSIQEVLQHIIDAERVFAYRALCFARKDTTPLPGFDENVYADNSKAASRNWDDMVNEFSLLRKANEIMFASFDDEQLDTNGTTSGKSVYVLAIGFIMAGHVNHHWTILKERYLA